MIETKSTGTVSVTMRRKTEMKQRVTETTGMDTAVRVLTVLKQKNNRAETMEMTTTRTEITGLKQRGQKQWGRNNGDEHNLDENNVNRNTGTETTGIGTSETESGNKGDRNNAATAITL